MPAGGESDYAMDFNHAAAGQVHGRRGATAPAAPLASASACTPQQPAPAPGTPEFNAFVDRQAGSAMDRAMGMPLVRVVAGVVGIPLCVVNAYVFASVAVTTGEWVTYLLVAVILAMVVPLVRIVVYGEKWRHRRHTALSLGRAALGQQENDGRHS
jgi:hypothetical protein